MKRFQRIFFILSYVLFILPPFIWGLVELYTDNPRLEVHVISLIVNVIVLCLITGVCGIFIWKKKLHMPTTSECKQLIFGFIGNVVVYFYTFQNIMNLQDFVTVYLILLIVLVVRFFLIKREITAWELWILLPMFLVIDYLHLAVSGCGWTNYYSCYPNTSGDWFLQVLYVLIFLITAGYYGYKIYQYKRYNFFGIANIALVIIVSFLLQELFELDEKWMGTFSIALAFFIVLDFIVSIVNKTYSHRTLLFYIRTCTFIIIFALLSENRFFEGFADEGMLPIMVVITYVSLGINILKGLLHVQEEADDQDKQLKYIVCTEAVKELIRTQYSDKHANRILMDDTTFTIVAFDGDTIIGFLSTQLKEFKEPLDSVCEANVEILVLNPEYHQYKVAERFIDKTEHYMKRIGATQMAGWSPLTMKEGIELWQSKGYVFTPYTEDDVEAYYFVKKL